MRIVRLDRFNAFDRIATAERQEWIAAPFAPFFEAAERSTRFEISGILSSPAPDGQRRGEQLGSTGFDIVEQSRAEFPLLGVLAPRIELADDETTRMIL